MTESLRPVPAFESPGASTIWDHTMDDEQITVHSLASVSQRTTTDVRKLLGLYGIVPDWRTDTVRAGELRAANQPRGRQVGEADSCVPRRDPRLLSTARADARREAAAFSAACTDDSENEPPDFDVDDGFGA